MQRHQIWALWIIIQCWYNYNCRRIIRISSFIIRIRISSDCKWNLNVLPPAITTPSPAAWHVNKVTAWRLQMHRPKNLCDKNEIYCWFRPKWSAYRTHHTSPEHIGYLLAENAACLVIVFTISDDDKDIFIQNGFNPMEKSSTQNQLIYEYS